MKFYRLAAMVLVGLGVCGAQAQREGWGGGPGRGGMMGGLMGSGVLGTVTAVASDHYSVKTDDGSIYTIFFSANSRIVKQTARAEGQRGGPPEFLKPADIKVGDVVMASGETDQKAHTVGAMFIVQIDAERARLIRERQANFGKTWLAGKVTALHELTVTVHSQVDNADHSFTVDENSSFMKRREPVTLADVALGDEVAVEGSVKSGTFVAAKVNIMGAIGRFPREGEGHPMPGAPPQ